MSMNLIWKYIKVNVMILWLVGEIVFKLIVYKYKYIMEIVIGPVGYVRLYLLSIIGYPLILPDM